MLKRYAFLLLLSSLSVLGMQKPASMQCWVAQDDEQNMSHMVDELLSFDETDQRLISREDSNENLLQLNTDVHNLVQENDQHLQKKLENIVPKVSSNPGSLESFGEMGRFEEKIYDLINSFKSINDANTIKDVLKYCSLWAKGDEKNKKGTSEWISDMHEQILERLAFKFGAIDKLKEMAFEFGTTGAMSWLSKQQKLCQSIPSARLNDLLMQTQASFTHCDEPKTVALASLLNNTSCADATRNALCKSLHTNIQFIESFKNPESVGPKIISRIAILGRLGYLHKGKDTWSPVLMHAALQSKYPMIAEELELRGVINPNKPLLPYFKTKYNTPNKETVFLDKTYAAKKDEEVPEFHWTSQESDAKLKKSKYVKLINQG